MMKPLFATALLVLAAMQTAQAQTPPANSAAKPKAAAAAPARPAVQSPTDTANDMARTDRLSLQSDLAWLGLYNGAINGEVSDRMVAAIKAFQKDHGYAKQSGVLNPQERGVLADEAKKLQDNVGWKIVSDPQTGARIGLPTKLVPTIVSDPSSGTRWSSSTGTIQVEITRRKEAGATTASVFDKEKKANARKVEYSAVKPDFFVLSGLQGLKKFYIRGQTRDAEVRIMTVLYDQATEGTMVPVTVAMSSAFNPFPSGAVASAPARKKVEYSTGVIVSTDGAIIADRQATDSCASIVVQGYGNADRIADEESTELALLRIYGARDLKPIATAATASLKPTASVIGIADPQNQGGRAAVSSAAESASGEALSPELAIGFSGSAAVDADGRFTGMARLKSATVASATGTPLPAQSLLVSGDAVRAFLKANSVAAFSGASDAKASVVRLICVRK
jgi:peptidoglycan hydrolase-like protein with peptidoglycan-binding domain